MSCDNHKDQETEFKWGNMDCPQCVADAIDNAALDFYQFGGALD